MTPFTDEDTRPVSSLLVGRLVVGGQARALLPAAVRIQEREPLTPSPVYHFEIQSMLLHTF